MPACSRSPAASTGISHPLGQDDEAAYAASPANIASLTEVIQRNPNDAQAYNMRGTVLGRAGRNQEALADFNKAVALDANYAQAYANRGLVHRQINQLDLALADYNKALAIDQNYAAAYLGRGLVHASRAAALDALNDFNRAIQIRPTTRRPITIAACSIRPGPAPVRDRRFLDRDRLVAARGRAARRARAEPSRARRPQGRGERPRRRGADRAAELHAWTSRGLAYERLGDKEKAAGSYAKALNINKDHEPAQEGFERVGGKTGRPIRRSDRAAVRFRCGKAVARNSCAAFSAPWRSRSFVPAAGKRTIRFGLGRDREQPLADTEIGTTRSRRPCRISTGAFTLPMRSSERNWSFISSRTGRNG